MDTTYIPDTWTCKAIVPPEGTTGSAIKPVTLGIPMSGPFTDRHISFGKESVSKST